MECLPVSAVAEGKEWFYEAKHDGYRAIAIKQDNQAVIVYSRNGKMLTQVTNLYPALNALKAKQFIIDGEAVVLDAQGRSSFALMQKIRVNKKPATFFAFDLLHVDGEDLLNLPLRERRQRLEQLLTASPQHVRLSPVLNGSAQVVIAKVREFELEGIVAKRWDSLYEPGERSGAWQKHKTQRTDDFVVGGYIGEKSVEQLVVGEWREGKLYFVEAVKNGFVPQTRRDVWKAIQKLGVPACPFVNLPEKKRPHSMDEEKMKQVHWVKPRVAVKLAFNERTGSGHLRHSKFLRLRA